MLNFGPHFLDQHSRDTLVMDSPPHPPSESGPRKCAMMKLVVLLWLSIMTPAVSDSEGGCGGESITKSGPTKSWSKQEFAIFISILIYTYGRECSVTYFWKSSLAIRNVTGHLSTGARGQLRNFGNCRSLYVNALSAWDRVMFYVSGIANFVNT